VPLNSGGAPAENTGWNHNVMVAFQYRFVTTVDDLVDADAIERARQPVLAYRWLVEMARQLEPLQLWVIGGLLAFGALIFVLLSTWGDRLALAAVAGLFPLYHFVIAPRRARTRRTGDPSRGRPGRRLDGRRERRLPQAGVARVHGVHGHEARCPALLPNDETAAAEARL
jgi:hypothetical protein